MTTKRQKRLVTCLFGWCLSCAFISLVVAAFMLHPAFGVAMLAAIFYLCAQLLSSMYKDLEREETGDKLLSSMYKDLEREETGDKHQESNAPADLPAVAGKVRRDVGI